MSERDYLIAKAQRVLYRPATPEETAYADKRNKRIATGWAATGAGYGAGVGMVKPIVIGAGRKATLRRAGKGALIGAAVAAPMAGMIRRGYKNEAAKGGVYTYEVVGGKRPGKPFPMAGDPKGDDDTFFGEPQRQVKRLPSDRRR